MSELLLKVQVLSELYVIQDRPVSTAMKIIRELPTINLVRCRECKKHGKNSCPMTFTYAVITDDNNYCSYGERRTDE